MAGDKSDDDDDEGISTTNELKSFGNRGGRDRELAKRDDEDKKVDLTRPSRRDEDDD